MPSHPVLAKLYPTPLPGRHNPNPAQAGGESLGRHLIQQHVPITRQNYNVNLYWPIAVVEGCPEKATYRDARSEVKLCCLLGGRHSPGDLVFVARWRVAEVFEYLVGALHDIGRSHHLGSTHDFQRVEAVAELEWF